MTVLEFMKATFDSENEYVIRQPIVCKDGFTVSVQGGTSLHYCIPCCHKNEYNKVELGYPSMVDSLILEYAEDNTRPTGTVYGYVPIEVVEKLIQKHGGIKL